MQAPPFHASRTAASARFAVAAGIVVIAVFLVIPFFAGSRPATRGSQRAVPWTHDMAQHVSVLEQFDAAVAEGSWYPRWQGEFNGGYGLPWLNFYPPGFYFLTEPLKRILGDSIRAIATASLALMMASGFSIYLLSRRSFSRVPSAAGAAFYMAAPYHTIDLWWRGALPELAAFALVPLLFLGVYDLGRRGRARDYALSGAAFGALLMCHLPTAWLMTLAIALYATTWSLVERSAAIAFRIAAGSFLGFVVSAAYWLPAMAEAKYVREPFTAIFPYAGTYLWLPPRGDDFTDLMAWTSGLTALPLLGAIVVFWPGRGQVKSSTQSSLFAFMGLTATFMLLPGSDFVSRAIPYLYTVTFAWRWLLIVTCCAAIAIAAAIEVAWRPGNTGPIATAVMVTIIVASACCSGVLMATASVHRNLDAPLQRTELGFLPGGAPDPDSLPDTPKARLASGQAGVVRWGQLRRTVSVNASRESTLRLKTFAFPGWRARLDGSSVPIQPDADGAQTVAVPAGAHVVELTFENTQIRAIATLVSVVGIALIAGLVVVDRRRKTQRDCRDESSVSSA